MSETIEEARDRLAYEHYQKRVAVDKSFLHIDVKFGDFCYGWDACLDYLKTQDNAALSAARAEIAQWQVERDIRVKAMEEQQREIERLTSLDYAKEDSRRKDALSILQAEHLALKEMADFFRSKLAEIAEWKDIAMDDKTAYEMREEARKALEGKSDE